MPRWFSKTKPPPEDLPAKPGKNASPALPERRARDVSGKGDQGSRNNDPGVVQARLKEDLAELLTAHRHQGRVLERSQKQLEQAEQDLAQLRTRASALEREIAEQRTLATQRATEIRELELLADKHATLEASYEAIDRERKDLDARLAELTRSRANADAERERLAADLAGTHATIAARDGEIAALKVEHETAEARVIEQRAEIEKAKKENQSIQAELERAIVTLSGHHRLQLEFDALSARWEVARAQLAEAEQALKTSQATIKAAQKLSSSVEWRRALDGILDAASELVRFERGTLALVDELQKDLKIEAARNSPIAVSEMSRFKVGEGIAGWALSHRESVLVRDSRSDPRFKASDPKHQPRSFIAVPLLADKEGLGVLTLARPATDPFTEHDLRNMARVANDASTALINARLVDLLKQREDRLTTLVRKARELSAANDHKQVVEFVLSSAQELVGGNAALLAVRHPKTSELEIIGAQGIADAILQQRIAWGAPAASDVMRSGQAWVSPLSEMLPPNLQESVEAAGLKMIVCVLCGTPAQPEASDDGALLSRSEVEMPDLITGVLNVYRNTLDPIASADLEQLKAFAEQAAVAIQNVRRWDRVKEQLQATASMNTRLMGRERYINQLLFRIQQLEQELGRYKAA
jgi:GAF domain-containing protein